MAIRDRLLAVVSHDLRNQLGVVHMGTELLSRKAEVIPEAKELRKPIDTVRRTADSMQRLVEDLVDMASLQAGRLSIECRPLVIEDVLEEAFHSHELIADAKGVRLSRHLALGGARVLGDRERLLQVLSNLLGNAIKFTDASGSVTLRARARDDEIDISVEDAGPGIPAEDLDRIFDPYHSIERSGQRGTGLGLYIGRGIVQRLGGRLTVRSTPGKGSTFIVTLPRVNTA